jgi:uncharacterized protein (TIGR02271 family)
MYGHASIHEGMKVHSRDGDDLGKIVQCTDESFVIEKGLFFPKDYTTRYDYVTDVREPDDVFISLSKDDLAKGRGEYPSQLEGEPSMPETTEVARIPLVEEKLEAEKQTTLAGVVRISKAVVTEKESVTAPVVHEEVRIERVPASRPAPAGSFGPGEIRIPLSEERLTAHKTPVVKEEILITKEIKAGQETISADVKKEIPEIHKEGELRERKEPPRQR